MGNNRIYLNIQQAKQKGNKLFATLIDPDKIELPELGRLLTLAADAHVDHIFIGGSLMSTNRLNEYITTIKDLCDIPIILFPGSALQISSHADAILLLSLISGRNAELLIGKHVEAAPILAGSGLEIISTGYMLIDGGAPTTASYISGTFPIPADKPDIAACTALAGTMLGLSTIYLDAGSGAKVPVSFQIIQEVKKITHVPIIVGGGINTAVKAKLACEAGADIVVVGNALEKEPGLITSIAEAVHSYKPILQN